MNCALFLEGGWGGEWACDKVAVSLVDGAPRCAEHTPKVEALTSEKAEEIETLDFLGNVVDARPRRPQTLPARRVYRRGYYGAGAIDAWGEHGDDDPDDGDGFPF